MKLEQQSTSDQRPALKKETLKDLDAQASNAACPWAYSDPPTTDTVQ